MEWQFIVGAQCPYPEMVGRRAAPGVGVSTVELRPGEMWVQVEGFPFPVGFRRGWVERMVRAA